MASMRDIKRRKSSIQSTQQITKAMKLVSTVKLQKARSRAEQTAPYFHSMYQTVTSILEKSGTIDHPYLKKGKSVKKAVVVITSNRGLAGGYNSNVVGLVTGNAEFRKEDLEIYAIGNKGREAFERRGYGMKWNGSEIIEAPTYEAAVALCRKILVSYTAGEIGEIYLAYTHFKNTVSHEPRLMKLLPVEFDEEKIGSRGTDGVQSAKEHDEKEHEAKEYGAKEHETGEPGSKVFMNYEPNEEEVLERMIPKYVTSLFYGALMEAAASENGARMQAMDSATGNAEEIISDLTLKYNRARQGTITQELTEIIAGAAAISQ